MAALPWMPLYPADYLADTAHLTRAQSGSYMLLLMNYWQTGKALDNSGERLASVARMSSEEWAIEKPILAEFFTIKRGKWIHKRVENDLQKVFAKSTQASHAASTGARKRANERLASAQRNLSDTDTDTDTDTRRSTATAPDAARRPPKKNGHRVNFNFQTGKFEGVTEGDELRWQEAYPAIAVPVEIDKAASWMRANPANRKKNYERYIVNWLSRAQERAPRINK